MEEEKTEVVEETTKEEEIDKVEKPAKVEKVEESKKNNKNKLLWIIPIVIILVIAGLIYQLMHFKYTDLTAEEIIKEMELPRSFSGYKVSTEVDNIIPSKSKIEFRDDKIEEESEEDYTAGSISVFSNEEEAELYKERVQDHRRETRLNITSEEFGYLADGVTYFEYVIVSKNVVLRLNDQLPSLVKNEYKIKFDNIVDACKYTQENLLSAKDIEAIKKASKEAIKNSMENFRKSAEESMQEMAAIIDKEIKEVKKSLDDKDVKKVKEAIETLYYGNIFREKREEWNKEFKNIEELILKKEKEEAEKKRLADLKKRTKTLSTGTHIVGEDIKPGKYDAIAKSGNGNFFVYRKK